MAFLNKYTLTTTLIVIGIISAVAFFTTLSPNLQNNQAISLEETNEGGPEEGVHPLSIAYLRELEYPGSDIVVEQTLAPGSNYQRFITSYQSEGLKQFALLTIPNGLPPEEGWPGIIFNHGYISPSVYKTTERYLAYIDAFSKNGYVVFKPDYRGHGNSEGEAGGGYGNNNYTVDVLNAFSSLQKYESVNHEKIGMWGHSMGGHITLRSMVVNPNIKAGVIWAGVVGSYQDLVEIWPRHRANNNYRVGAPTGRRSWRTELTQKYGGFEENPEFWDSISSTAFLSDISGPLQLHHATGDTSVPKEFSELLQERMEQTGKESELYIYQGDDHNISANFSTAISRSIEFFDRYLKDN